MCSPEKRARAASDHRLCICACALALAAAAGQAAAAAPAGAQSMRDEVRAIVEELRKNPDLKPTQTVPTLKWKHADEAKEDEKPVVDPFVGRIWHWLVRASRWLAEAGRWSIWLLGALAVALLLVGLRYWIRERAAPFAAPAAAPTAWVGALDVRPESLPPDIRSAAHALWSAGDARRALSLLYRAALSRLIHERAVPIRAAHTEPECLRLARGALDEDAAAYFGRLLRLWEAASYGGRQADAETFFALCDAFDGWARPGAARESAS